MSNKRKEIEKKTFIGLVITKLVASGYKNFAATVERQNSLDKQYKSAQRIARERLRVKTNDPSCKASTEQFYQELETLMKGDPKASVAALTVTDAVIKTGDVEVTPNKYQWAVDWFNSIDNGTIFGTVGEAKQFISKVDKCCDRLQQLMVKQAKKDLKALLIQAWELETVLDKSDIENVWLEVEEEKGKLVVEPFSIDKDKVQVELTKTDTD